MSYEHFLKVRRRRRQQLTPRRREVLKILARWLETKGYSPSVRELMRELGLRSPATVQNHLESLERDGFLVRSGPGIRPWRPSLKGRERAA